jgi:hypothetical protein
MKRIYQHTSKAQEEKKKSPVAKASHQLDIANIQRAIEEPTQDNLTPDVMMAIQQTHGNQFAAQLSGGTRYPVQAKLTVTEANDQYEQEADTVAEQVVSGMNDAPVQREGGLEEEEMLQGKRDPLQRQEEEEELQMKRNPLQRRKEEELIQGKLEDDMMGGMDVSSDVESQIEQARGGGQTLPDNVRSGMESGFGADFSNVRVHTDSTADNLSRSVQAQAFTTGSDIFFKQGTYDPGSQSGQKLLAHELTHTIQQGAVQKTDDDTSA